MLSLASYLDFGGNGDGIPGVVRGTTGNRLAASGPRSARPARATSRAPRRR